MSQLTLSHPQHLSDCEKVELRHVATEIDFQLTSRRNIAILDLCRQLAFESHRRGFRWSVHPSCTHVRGHELHEDRKYSMKLSMGEAQDMDPDIPG